MTKTHTASTMKNEWIEIIGASDEQLTSYAKQYAIPDDYLSGVNDEFEIARMEETPPSSRSTTYLSIVAIYVS